MLIVALAAMWFSSAGPARAESPSRAGKPEYVPGRVIVKFKPSVGHARRSAIRRQEKLEKLRDLGLIRAEVLTVRGRSVEEAVRALGARADVEYAEPDYILQLDSHSNEPYFNSLWGLHNTGQTIQGVPGISDVDTDTPEAAQITLGSPAVAVGVIDTGIDFSHPDLSGQQWVNRGEVPGNGTDDDRNGYVDDVNGWDFFNWDGTVYDSYDGDEHGTHVAGTIAAKLDGRGVVGVAPGVKVMSLKICGRYATGEVGCSTSGSISALDYAARMGVKVTNNSYGKEGSKYYSQAQKDAIERSGILFVAAAGNGGPDHVGDDNELLHHYPSDYDSPNILSVAAIQNRGGLGTFSNYGATSVDISAPGVSILSTVPGNGYEWYNGTSMAAPHVTGSAALVLSKVASLGSDVTALKQVLMDTGKPLPATAGKTVTGKMVDPARALYRLLDSTPPVASAPVPKVEYDSQINTGYTPNRVAVRLSWAAATDNMSGISRYALAQSTDGGASWTYVYYPGSTLYGLRALSFGSSYRYCVAAQDGGGNWSQWACDPADFKVYGYQETPRTSTPLLSYSSGWASQSSSTAWGAYVRYTGTAGASTTFTFQGRAVAWVASRAPDRGQAKVYLNGTYLRTVDLYSSAATARRVVLAMHGFNPAGTNKVEIRVVGTSGRPRIDIDGFVVLR
jgi:subtilisin family serine protease